MADYLVRLRLEAPLATPLISGTLFGQLCWAWRELWGEDSLVAWLRSLGDDPFLLSSACPVGCLPRPVLQPAPARQAVGLDEAKKLRKAAWLAAEDFFAMRAEMSEAAVEECIAGRSDPARPLIPHRAAHNTINRLTGTTPEAGGLYFVDEAWPAGVHEVDVYVRTSLEQQPLEALFAHVGRHGYGRDASLGRGVFRVAAAGAADPRLFSGSGNRMMSLSHASLTANMLEPRYRLHTHYGKLGGWWATGGNPFKHPLTLLRPGATFQPADGGPFGELLDGVHPEKAEVRHHAWHLAVPYTEA